MIFNKDSVSSRHSAFLSLFPCGYPLNH
uniref:Uncharacterized protein n=1 Tax=Rhizophora mucronata TaxID=61149 RepID=A0A2P2NQY6_RHIMU